ncbi:MAG TPA: hypothetical protein VMS76_20195 [Planctomycetota bacterium]|nr:hypothetical protein [Planctomycetota bacterium]
MSGEHEHLHEHLNGEQLAEALLGGAGAAEGLREEARICERCACSLRELEGFVIRCRSALGGDLAPARQSPHAVHSEERLVRRVLARTTREDLSWRGDLRVWGDWLGRALRSSLVLRVAAASLLLHLAALPVLAWLALRGERAEPHFNTAIEAAADPAPPQAREPERDPRLEDPEPAAGLVEEPSAPARPAPRASDALRALRRDREALRNARLPAPAGGAPEDTLERLLWARSALWTLHDAQAAALAAGDALADPTPHPTIGDGLELALRAELLLDLFALEGALADELRPELNGVLRSLARDASLPPPVRELQELALERARRYGLAAAGRSSARFGRVERGAALDEIWLATFRRALGTRGAEPRGMAAAWAALTDR